MINAGFELPEYTHTDRTVTIKATASGLGSLDIVWSVVKDGEAVAWDTVIDGRLSNDGGTIASRKRAAMTSPPLSPMPQAESSLTARLSPFTQ